MDPTHTWSFFRAGGFDQVKLKSASDLLALDQLDQKLWVALACPTTGLEFDSRTLALIDTDHDGRIRAPEVIAAAKWACRLLKNPEDLLLGAPQLPLSAINDAIPEGKQLVSSARQILANLGNPEASAITVEETLDAERTFAQGRFNGDGILPPESAEDDALKAVIADIIACTGAETDRNGKPGTTQPRVDQFFADATAFLAWWDKAQGNGEILPPDGTPAAASAYLAVKAKLDDYFIRCRLSAFDPRSASGSASEPKDALALPARDLSARDPAIASLPLAPISGVKPLPLAGSINPAWSDAVEDFNVKVVNSILGGRVAVSEEDWDAICTRFAPYDAWLAAKPGASVEKLGVDRVREVLNGKSREAITALIARDKAKEGEAGAVAAVERLTRYYRDLYTLVNNFVCFRDFYSGKGKAIFQAGTLYLDQRSCDLCVAVTDPAKHAAMAGLSGTYLAYCDCARKGSTEKRQIVAAFTDGDSENLMVGRNGVFYDRQGVDWDATIARIVDNPISVRQAFWAPYRKVAQLIREQVTKRASAAADAAAAGLKDAVAKAQAAPAEAAAKKIDPGLIAALSVGAAGLGGMVGSIMMGFLSLKWLMPLGVVGIILIISGPAMLLAWMKLHGRNLGPILDANGWALNAKARINVPFGASLTRVASLPSGAQRDVADLFAEKHHPWKLYLALIVVLALALSWWQGWLDQSLPYGAKSTTVLSTNAPAYKAAPAAK